MTIRPETEACIHAVEVFANRSFRFHDELAMLLQLASDHGMRHVFDEVTFYAKFLVNASHILKRSGPGSEETEKLSTEFKSKIEQTSTLIRAILQKTSRDVRDSFEEKFLSLSHSNFDNFLSLLYELSWIKNYSLDCRENA